MPPKKGAKYETVVTERMRRLPAAMVANNFILSRAMKAVGYSDHYIHNQKELRDTKGYKIVMEPFLKQLEKKRQMTMDALTEDKIKKANAPQMVQMVDTLTKNVQLLSGAPTERVNHMAELTDEQLARIAAGIAGTGETGTSPT